MRRSIALLLALLLLAAQSARLAHEHADDARPAGQQAQVCELCTAFQAGAPAPDPVAAASHVAVVISPAIPAAQPAPPARVAAAHRSRAPPSFHSS